MKVDICIATKNSLSTLPILVNSIQSQLSEVNSELLIADGSSSDKTIEYLEKLDSCKIISYADNSPEEGLNKLIKFQPENLKVIIGSDDWVSDDYLSSFAFEADKLLKKGINKFILIPKFYKNIGGSFLKLDFPIPFFFLNFIGIGRGIGWGIFHKEGRNPLFSENLKIASDYDYLLKCLRDKYYFKYVSCRYFHLKNGRSSKNWLLGLKEEREIGLKYKQNIFQQILINLFFTIKFFYKIVNKLIHLAKSSNNY